MIYPVLDMVFENYEKVGLELDNVFNAHNDKTIGGQRGKCHVYMTSQRIIEEGQESTKEDSQESCER